MQRIKGVTVCYVFTQKEMDNTVLNVIQNQFKEDSPLLVHRDSRVTYYQSEENGTWMVQVELVDQETDITGSHSFGTTPSNEEATPKA